jgi:hypothetical protein
LSPERRERGAGGPCVPVVARPRGGREEVDLVHDAPIPWLTNHYRLVYRGPRPHGPWPVLGPF